MSRLVRNQSWLSSHKYFPIIFKKISLVVKRRSGKCLPACQDGGERYQQIMLREASLWFYCVILYYRSAVSEWLSSDTIITG